MSTANQESGTLGTNMMSIALIGPEAQRRKAVASALAAWPAGETREFSSYPPSLDDVPRLLEQNYDVIIIDLDSNPEYALDLVESICVNGQATVMIYSAKADSELLVRCMRAGAREFLTTPFAPGVMAEALVRASVRRPTPRAVAVAAPPPQGKKTEGRFLVFMGAKGGAGVTTLACNYAVSLAQESGLKTLLIDLDLPFGSAAIDLGITAEYSTMNALQNSSRLDSSFFSRLVAKHSSGLFVLASPGKVTDTSYAKEDMDKMLEVARQEYDYVVVDAGCRLDLTTTPLFGKASTVYLVTQVGVPELRNSNVLITEFFSSGVPELEIVLNRYMPRSMGIDEEHITKALTRPAQWRIPCDYATTRRMQNLATPLAMEDTPISRAIRDMARAVCGLEPEGERKSPDKKKRFVSLFG
jgi:pilus assembly protein CpaE